MEPRRLKWWGWGFDDTSLPIESRPVLWSYLLDRLEADPNVLRRVVPLESIQVPVSLLSPRELDEFREVAGDEGVSIADADRVVHALGKGYKDLVRLRSGQVRRTPDVVLYPTDEEAVRRILDLARQRRYAVIPFGGGTGVVGGVEPSPEGGFAASLSVDLRRMHRVLEIDDHSGYVTAEAGILGPELEDALMARGLTLGHFPQSFEFSTLGGWIATRAAGGLSNLYGKIEEIVVGLRLVTPTRTLEIPPLPGMSHGPDLKELVLGSEGILGIITQATLRVQPRPRVRQFASRLFRSFAAGLTALRAMARDASLPDMAYLGDEEETRFAAANAGIDPRPGAVSEAPLGLRLISLRGYSLESGSLLLMGFEGSPSRVSHRRSRALDHAAPAADLGASPAERWFAERFRLPYLRDSLLDHGILVDTVETAAPWSRLQTVYEAGRAALQAALGSAGEPGLVLCHVSHAYRDGASLYFTFMGRQREGDELVQWEGIKVAVTKAFLGAGGALSHHHGIGADHSPFLGQVIGEDGLFVLRALKRSLDPEGIMNPGKLFTGIR